MLFTSLTVALLLVFALAHALRLWLGWPVTVDGSALPMWASVVGLGLAVVLAIGLWREGRVRIMPIREGGETRGPGSRAPKTFTVRQGKRYRAAISLGFFEQIASNDTIAGMLRDAGFAEVKVAGSGGARTAEALWPGADQSGEMPGQITSVSEIA